jgi:hypothetical protein
MENLTNTALKKHALERKVLCPTGFHVYKKPEALASRCFGLVLIEKRRDVLFHFTVDTLRIIRLHVIRLEIGRFRIHAALQVQEFHLAKLYRVALAL